MPTYVVKCGNCGPQETVARMSEAAEFMACPVCRRPRPQVFHVPQFTEDRTHMWKGPMGNGYSFALGEQMPDSRQARDRLARQKGVEFCSRDELLRDNKEAAEAVAYKAYVDSGGSRDVANPVDTSAFQAKPAWAKDLIG